jgi:hypothetical protein
VRGWVTSELASRALSALLYNCWPRQFVWSNQLCTVRQHLQVFFKGTFSRGVSQSKLNLLNVRKYVHFMRKLKVKALWICRKFCSGESPWIRAYAYNTVNGLLVLPHLKNVHIPTVQYNLTRFLLWSSPKPFTRHWQPKMGFVRRCQQPWEKIG